MLRDGLGDEARGDGRAVEVQHLLQLGGVDLQLVDQQLSALRVAVLLDDEDRVVRGDELAHAVGERKGAQAQASRWMPCGGQLRPAPRPSRGWWSRST
jgi:hypothetical protein